MHAKTTTTITYPYMPDEGVIKYVDPSNTFMRAARDFAANHSLDKAMPNASILVKDNMIIGRGANGSNYHETHECERIRLGIPTGQGYDLCEGCHPKNHSEPKAIADALARGHDVKDAVIFLWGHWWCCEPCWQAMLNNGVSTVYLLQHSEVLFNKAAEGNIVGHQLEAI